MKISYYTLLFALLLCLSDSGQLIGQLVVNGGSAASTLSTGIRPPSGTRAATLQTHGAPMQQNDYVQDQLIVSFNQPLSVYEQGQFKGVVNNWGGELKAFSPKGYYALIDIPYSADACELLGEGNPGLPTEGQGHTYGLNYVLSTIAWSSTEDTQCVTTSTSVDFTNYSPASNCSSFSNTTPSPGSSSVRVAVIDSGVVPTTRNTLNGSPFSQDKIDAEGNFIHPGTPAHAHGSLVANIIVGIANGQGIEDQVAIHSYEVLNSELRATTFAVIAAIEDATFNTQKPQTHIISLSIGFIPTNCGGGPEAGAGDPLNIAISQARNAGIIVITSAGNSDKDLDLDPQYPAAYDNLNNIITVGAMSCDFDRRVTFSNYSENHVDLYTNGSYLRALNVNCFWTIHGTSFATPIVSAKAAIHVTNQANYDHEKVLCLLRDQSRDFPGSDSGYESIYGIVDAGSSRGNKCNKKGLKPFTASKVKNVSTGPVVSPNPFNGPLTVVIPGAVNGLQGTLTVYDGNGKVLLRTVSHQTKETLDLSTLRPGVYWLNVQSGSDSTTRPIVKR